MSTPKKATPEGGWATFDAYHGPVHTWFELSYAQYLTVPRSILQSMPREWQERFVACLNELDAARDWRPAEGRYWVRLKDGSGKYVADPFMQYRHPQWDELAAAVIEVGA